jgi:uncharacterized repeat protein (TIGR03837 family)
VRIRLWDVFCRVIDNHGDLGVCWRLAADLATRGEAVRLWVDDPQALAWMAPEGAPGVQVLPWRDPGPGEQPGDVVIEAFGCDPPGLFVQRMAQRHPAPAWINLEYLSAEDYVRRSHGLPSPQCSGPGAGLTKWFFYPGFTAGTGGLLREPGLPARQAGFDPGRLRQALGLEPADGIGTALLFCYDNPALPAWLEVQARQRTPTRLWVMPGPAARQVGRWLGVEAQAGETAVRGALHIRFLPFVPQARFDELLWAADLNFVRGEDSLVRALWAGKPFVWHIYPQPDGAHAPKLAAFLAHYVEGAGTSLAAAIRQVHGRWNGLDGDGPLLADEAWPDLAWQHHAVQRAQDWARQPDLASELRHFATKLPQPRSG